MDKNEIESKVAQLRSASPAYVLAYLRTNWLMLNDTIIKLQQENRDLQRTVSTQKNKLAAAEAADPDAVYVQAKPKQPAPAKPKSKKKA